MRKTIIGIFLIMIVFVIATALMSYVIMNGNSYLKNFDIISVDNINTHFNIKFEKVKAAKYYELIIYNSDNTIFYKDNISNNEVSIDLNDIIYNNKYIIDVIAYDNEDNSISANNPYIFTYAEPTFSKDNSLVLSNEKDYVINIMGDLSKKDYYIALLDGKYTILKEKIGKNEYVIPRKYYTGIKQILTVNLYNGNSVINTIDLYSNISPVKDIKITSPKGDIVEYDDLILSYEGGENATSYKLEIYNEDVLLKNITINNKSIIISSDFFKKGREYRIKVNALYNNYKEYMKSDEISFKVSSKNTLKPAYININPNYVKKGDLIELYNPNKDGKIYYTLDGSDPTSKSNIYKDKIEVKDNMIIKTLIKDKNSNDSVVNTFNVNINTKDSYKVYLSVGNNTSLKEIANVLIPLLKKQGIIVYYNQDGDSVNKRINDAKNKKTDLYLALYDNVSDIDDNGIESWIYDINDESYSLANLIHNNLLGIYKEEGGNKGIKKSGNAIDELGLNKVKLKIMINLGYENSEIDQKWLIQERDLIANTIASTIFEYFDLI